MKKTIALLASAAMFSVLIGCPASLKQAATMDLANAAGKAANAAIKATNESMEPKVPVKNILIVGIPPQYQSYYAQVMAVKPEDPNNVCMPYYLTKGYQNASLDTINDGKVWVSLPCDTEKRLITVILSHARGGNEAVGLVYSGGVPASEVCKSKESMPVYNLSEQQTFHFIDFIKNEDCKAVADGAGKK